jgi:hypothetical protein
MRLKVMKILVKSLKNQTEQYKQPVKLSKNEVILDWLIETLFDIR